jgi:hypothetical protein
MANGVERDDHVDKPPTPAHHSLMGAIVLIALLSTILAAPSLARAGIFAWHDPEGVIHFVDNLDNVPKEHREDSVTFVKDWQRPPPPAESVSAPPAPDDRSPVPSAVSVPSAQMVEMALSSFERGFWAGRQSDMAAQPALADVPASPPVVNVIIAQPPQEATTFPFFGPVFPGSVFPAGVRPFRKFVFPRRFFRGGFFFRSPFFHRGFFGGRFIQGPAGPAPLGAAGPPPVMFFHHFKR